MAARINYEDNVFFVSALIKALSTGVVLDIDHDYFGEKILGDVTFIHETLRSLDKSLRENVYLIRRTEYMRSLLRTVQNYVEFLDSLKTSDSAFAKDLSAHAPRFERYREEQRSVAAELQRALQGAAAPSSETEEIISTDEYRFLFEDQAAE
ncbi:MAG: hypothetical protein EA383_06085 [Spirochaetaceae bacterium]|nr:MAG: hypothetical protein EA383_06085 [Spirochaetaceae bacterium]